MKRILKISLCAVLFLSLFGCAKKYRVDYDGRKERYKGAEDSYPAGRKVTLYYDLIAADTDYAFYLDGERLNHGYGSAKGFVISFTMPEHDVKLTCETHNTMVYAPPEVPEEYKALAMLDEDEGFFTFRKIEVSPGCRTGENYTVLMYDEEMILRYAILDGPVRYSRIEAGFPAEIDELIEKQELRSWNAENYPEISPEDPENCVLYELQWRGEEPFSIGQYRPEDSEKVFEEVLELLNRYQGSGEFLFETF
ncbi:MAG: hypothetical protein IKE21_03135 [Erysipelotrichaceae bacterium]|nr:hypothetical protein [Erysipelotrichaceae bacterium]